MVEFQLEEVFLVIFILNMDRKPNVVDRGGCARYCGACHGKQGADWRRKPNRGFLGQSPVQILRRTFYLCRREAIGYGGRRISEFASIHSTPLCGAAMSAPSGANTAPFIELAGVSLKPPVSHSVLGWWSPQNLHRFNESLSLRALPLLPRLLLGVRVLLEEHRILGDDVRKYVSAFCAMTGSTANPPVLRLSTAFGRIPPYFYMKVDSDL